MWCTVYTSILFTCYSCLTYHFSYFVFVWCSGVIIQKFNKKRNWRQVLQLFSQVKCRCYCTYTSDLPRCWVSIFSYFVNAFCVMSAYSWRNNLFAGVFLWTVESEKKKIWMNANALFVVYIVRWCSWIDECMKTSCWCIFPGEKCVISQGFCFLCYIK